MYYHIKKFLLLEISIFLLLSPIAKYANKPYSQRKKVFQRKVMQDDKKQEAYRKRITSNY